MKSRNKGITLISLVITIVIMLILTGITINLLFGDNGIITKTKLAKKAFLGEDAKQVVEDRINAYIAEKGPEGELDLYDFWYMYNGDPDLETYDEDFIIYLFEDVAVNFPSLQTSYTKGTRYISAVVIYKGYQMTVNNKFTVAKEVKAIADLTEEDEDRFENEKIGESTWDNTKGIQTPALSEGMIPVKWNGSNWVITTANDLDWYNYDTSPIENIPGTEPTEANKWANIMLSDGTYKNVAGVIQDGLGKEVLTDGTKTVSDSELGSMFVWIPRYAYSIETNYGNSLANGKGGTINIEFLKTNATTSSVQGRQFTTTPGQGNWLIHPAFINNVDVGGWDSNIPGIWVSKFEASTPNPVNGTTQNVRVIPNVSSWRDISIGNMYTVCRNMTGSSQNPYGFTVDTDQGGTGTTYAHLMKNSEWGAVAYLAQSVKGTDNEVETNNNNYVTGEGDYKYYINQSTTGTIYGIYDMCGGVYEHTAAYLNNANGSNDRDTYGEDSQGNNFTANDKSSKYCTVYNHNASQEDTDSANWTNTTTKNGNPFYGDAVKETSYTGAENSSWFRDYSHFPYYVIAFFVRGGGCGSGSGSMSSF